MVGGTDTSNVTDLAGRLQRAIDPDRPAPVLSPKLAATSATGYGRDAAVAVLSGVCVQHPAASALAPRSVACAASWICGVLRAAVSAGARHGDTCDFPDLWHRFVAQPTSRRRQSDIYPAR